MHLDGTSFVTCYLERIWNELIRASLAKDSLSLTVQVLIQLIAVLGFVETLLGAFGMQMLTFFQQKMPTFAYSMLKELTSR